MTLLAASGLTKSYGGVRAVDGVDLEVASGEMVAMIGPNGAGKSTCFGLIGGQVSADAGKVRLDGADLDGSPARRARRGLGRTFQVAQVFASMSVSENLAVAARGRDTTLLERVGLGADAQRPAADLAYGDIKRLELALALATEPRVLLMDEPTAGMAPAERRQLMTLIAGLARETKLAVLFTEHDMDVVFGHADRILVLDRGKLIASGDPSAIRANARVREVYLGHGDGSC
ncbi:MAG: ABC transporter ATP-binding protein [Rhodospirillaceae bacterium]|nr:ABC transporter ATP-binding protein [Rhodospirillaceae bacterium]